VALHQVSRRLLDAVPRLPIYLMGPAFVAGIAYVDPGNVATNTAAGSRFGYLLVWVVVGANVVAMLVQYLSAKLGIATGKSLPRVLRERCSRRQSWALWAQAEIVALATDLAEVLGGAIALNLLFGVPLLVGGLITAVVSFAILTLQGPRTQRAFESVIVGLLAVIAFGFLWSAVAAEPAPADVVAGLAPQIEGGASLLLAAGMLGATVMPHAIYLHSAIIADRFGSMTGATGSARASLLRATRVDVMLAMAVAGAVNLAMLLMAAAALSGRQDDSIHGVHEGVGDALGPVAALFFAIALLASGFASSSVGTYAGAVILEGFLGRRLALPVRRLVTLVPAVSILAVGIDPTQALVMSQVVLSFGIPFALFPLVRLTQDKLLMRDLVNKRLTSLLGTAVAVIVSALNAVLIGLTLVSLT
jgi:manganese transport protein